MAKKYGFMVVDADIQWKVGIKHQLY